MSFVLRHVHASQPYAYFKSHDYRIVVKKDEADSFPTQDAAQLARNDRTFPDLWTIEEN